jgi:hypothetical protein
VSRVGGSTEDWHYSWDKETGILVERVITGIMQTGTFTERFTLIRVHGMARTVSERATTQTTLSTYYSDQYMVLITNALTALAPYLATITIAAAAVAIAVRRRHEKQRTRWPKETSG